MKKNIGVIGLAVMGENISLNIVSKGFSVAVYNLEKELTDDFMSTKAKGKDIHQAYSLKELADALERPRKIWIMIRAGSPVDQTIEALIPHLDKGDIIVDGGNSAYQDTNRRADMLAKKGIHFVGMGVSGGKEGALKGPSLMPGGPREAYELLEPILTRVSAKVNDVPCCTYIGPGGAGHFVKSVHNGIEYGDMQLISEAYMLLKHMMGMDARQLHETFLEWNTGDLNSYLIEITADIFSKTDPETGQPLVDMIQDSAGQKGTGKWVVHSALKYGVPVPTIAEAVFGRVISSLKDQRVKASGIMNGPKPNLNGRSGSFKNDIRDALFASKICSYAQGFALMREASREYNWNMNYGEIAGIWRGGCIIRAQLLDRIKQAYEKNPDLENLMLDAYFNQSIDKIQPVWRKVVAHAAQAGIPVPGFSSALSYYDSYRNRRLGANLIQAQRDYFGSHTYRRIDRDGVFHTDWANL